MYVWCMWIADSWIPKQISYGKLIVGKKKHKSKDCVKSSLFASNFDLDKWESLATNESEWQLLSNLQNSHKLHLKKRAV